MKRIRLWNVLPPLYNEEFTKVDENKTAMSMDTFIIDDGKIHSAMIICPGGGYEYRKENEAGGIAGWLNTLGISAFVLNYRVKPYEFPAPIVDAKRAVKFIRNFSQSMKIDPDKIGIMGFSTGAHLAAMTAEMSDITIAQTKDELDDISSEVNALGLCYPVISMCKDYVNKELKQTVTNGNQEIGFGLSAEMNVKEDLCPTFIWHCFQDDEVSYKNSVDMMIALKEKKVPVEYHAFEDGKHGIGETTDGVKQWRELYADWLRRIGF